MSNQSDATPVAMLWRLAAAANAHDIEALVECFTPDYVNETPAHPARGFTGREQVRTNWTQIFAAVPDIEVTVLRHAVAEDEIWSEWEMAGTRRDGSSQLMRGVVLFGVRDGRAASARFYLEPVDHGRADVNQAVRTLTGGAR
jgi:ketosteroid isomerase-like protein